MDNNKIIIFTDLDGTLLDHNNYDYTPALPALNFIKESGISLIIVSSKTAAEIEFWLKELKTESLYICENGSAIYFDPLKFPFAKVKNLKNISGNKIVLGTSLQELSGIFSSLKMNFPVTGMTEMSISEVMELTDLSKKFAVLAMQREYSIPFIINHENGERIHQQIVSFLPAGKYKITRGGRFYHLLGNTDKGNAVSLVISLMEKLYNRPVISVGIGDSPNDYDMLNKVNYPVLVELPEGGHGKKSTEYIKAQGKGPYGWNWTIENIVKLLLTDKNIH